jgi:hypothetical protein
MPVIEHWSFHRMTGSGCFAQDASTCFSHRQINPSVGWANSLTNRKPHSPGHALKHSARRVGREDRDPVGLPLTNERVGRFRRIATALKIGHDSVSNPTSRRVRRSGTGCRSPFRFPCGQGRTQNATGRPGRAFQRRRHSDETSPETIKRRPLPEPTPSWRRTRAADQRPQTPGACGTRRRFGFPEARLSERSYSITSTSRSTIEAVDKGFTAEGAQATLCACFDAFEMDAADRGVAGDPDHDFPG